MTTDVKLPLRRVSAGLYETLDGRYRIERQDGVTECDHPLCDPLHQRFWEKTGDGCGSMHWMSYVAWHVWDNVKDDYAGGDGPSEFDTKREAHQWLTDHLEKEASGSGQE